MPRRPPQGSHPGRPFPEGRSPDSSPSGEPHSGELPWTPSEERMLNELAATIAPLRDGARAGTLTVEDGRRFAKAAFALQQALKEKKERSLRHESLPLQEARDILGPDNVFGPEAIKATWDRDLAPSEIPAIPYSREQLEGAKAMNMMLVLRVDKDKDGNPLTGERMNEIIQPKLTAADKGKLLHKVDWYKAEPCYTIATSKLEWKLVTRDLLSNSKNIDYADQTKLLRDMLALQPDLTQAEQDAIAEATDTLLAQLKTQEANDKTWKRAASALSTLKINANHRRGFTDVLFDHATLLETKDERLFGGNTLYDWTHDRSSDGSLVHAGHAGADGVSVDRWWPGGLYGVLGVSLSR